MDINKELSILYEQNWKEIQDMRSKNDGLSPPLLMKLPDDYLERDKRLFFIGQETHSWYNELERYDVNVLQELYRGFIEKEVPIYRSPFWSMVREIVEDIGTLSNYVAWSNLNRMDLNKKRPKKYEIAMIEKFSMLPKELEICNPTHIIFFTGPFYDELIQKIFPKVKVIGKLNEEFEERQLTELQIPTINAKCCRSYHPGYISHRGKEYKNKVISAIVTFLK